MYECLGTKFCQGVKLCLEALASRTVITVSGNNGRLSFAYVVCLVKEVKDAAFKGDGVKMGA